MKVFLMMELFSFLKYSFVQVAVISTVLVTLISGLLSPIVVLKERSYLVDTLSHLVFPGVVVGLILASISSWPLWICVIAGAAAAALIGAGLSEWILGTLKIPPDASAVACLTSFFSFGIILISYHRGLRISPESLLFGDVLTTRLADLYLLTVVFLICFVSIFFLEKHWNAWVSDKEFAQIAGYRIKLLQILFPILTTMAVLSGIFAVGGLMIAALMTIPALIYQPRSVFSPLIVLVSLSCGLLGIIFAFQFNLPVGPSIVLVGFFMIIAKGIMLKIRSLH